MKSYEDELQTLIDKVEGISDKDWEEMVDDLDLNCHPDSLRKSFNTGRYCGYRVAKYYQNKIDNDMYSSDELAEIERKKDELYKETVKLRDQRRERNKQLMSEARIENLMSAIKESIDEMPDLHSDYKSFDKTRQSDVEACAMISDIHLGMKCDNQFNYYDVEVAEERLNHFKDRVIYYCREQNVGKLNIEILGDCISGLIHGGVRVAQEEDVISQLMIVCELLANIISEIQQFIPNVVVYTVYGNHSRLISKKDESLEEENLERLIPFYLRQRLDKRIPIIDGGGQEFLTYKIKDKRIILLHGHNDSPSNALNNMVRMFGFVPDQIHLAHRHHVAIDDDCDTEVICNGSVVGTDGHTVTIRKSTKPSQLLCIYGDDFHIYKINLE